ncbi:MAG: molybdenum ABC transporter ATP-binding protein [Pseudomonadota bacterium]
MSLLVAIRHTFPGFALDVAFEAPDGVTALFGHSGSGKTTVVNAIAGLLRPDAGQIVTAGSTLLDTTSGVDIARHRRRIGYVFQDARLFPHMTVRQNLLFGRFFARARGRNPADVIDLLGLGALLHRRPGALSGGERQRVAIGRALLAEPRLLLMDEPLASLDGPRKAEIIPYLERLRDAEAVPILYVSHDVSEVARLATTVVAMEHGHVVRSGPARDILADPDSVPALGVREAGAVLDARVVSHDTADWLTELAVGVGPIWLPKIEAAPGTWLRLRISAHEITVARTKPEGLSALNVLPARVAAIREGAGPGAVLVLQVGEERLLARVTRRSLRELELTQGSTCFAVFKATAVARADIASAAGTPD